MGNRIVILNGPNLNLLGKREPSVYGNQSFEAYLETLRAQFRDCTLLYHQTSSEAELIDLIHQYGFQVKGIVLNAGAYTHTSVAIRDAIAAVTAPVTEVHISNVHSRETFRHTSMIAAVCRGVVCGFGLHSYHLAVQGLLLAE